MKRHHLHHASRVTIAAIFVMGIVVGASSLTLPLLALSSFASAVPKQTDSVIIATDEPKQLEESLDDKNIAVEDVVTTESEQTYVAVDAEIADARIKELRSEESDIIIKISPNYSYFPAFTPNDTYYSQQWNIRKVSAPATWDRTLSVTPSVVAVIDSGVLSSQSWGERGPYSHPDFPDSKIWKNQGEIGATTNEGATPNCTSQSLPLSKSCNNLDDDGNGYKDDFRGWDFMGGYYSASGSCPNQFGTSLTYQYITEDNDPQPYSCDDYTTPTTVNKDQSDPYYCGYGYAPCVLSHGTNVASFIAAATNNGAGVAAVDQNAIVMNLRVFDGMGYAEGIDIIAAIAYAIDNGADVINLSLVMAGGSGCTTVDPIMEAELARAKAAGVVVVGASGNNGGSTVCYPARSVNAIAVGASTPSDTRASFSTYGSELDLVAPGYAVPAANSPWDGEPGSFSSAIYGTSFAAPHVAGAAATLKSLYPSASAETIRQKLLRTADKVSGMSGNWTTTQYGYGRLNVLAASQPGAETKSPPAPIQSSLSRGKALKRGQSLKTSNGRRLTLQKDGNLVLYNRSNRPVWSTRTKNKGGYILIHQSDGNLVLYTSKKRPIWSSKTSRKSSKKLQLQTDGNLVLYSTSGRALWSSGTRGR